MSDYLDDLKPFHQPVPSRYDDDDMWCSNCAEVFPCDTAKAIAEVERLRGRVQNLSMNVDAIGDLVEYAQSSDRAAQEKKS